MPYHQCLTCSRQEAFGVEEDLRCESIDIEETDAAAKAAYLRCGKTSLIGEISVSAESKRDIFREAEDVLLRLCKTKEYEPALLEGRILVLACVLAIQNIEEAQSADDKGETWLPVLKALNLEKIIAQTGCSRQIVQKRLCEVLEDRNYIRFFTGNGKRFYNTLKVHAISPSQAYKNLFHILYSFYAENLDYCYEKGTNVTEMFVSALCRRWKNDTRPETTELRSDQLSSGIRELFVSRPHYMAAVCDALLEKIDQIVQGDMSSLDALNRWDILLKDWYTEKSEAERSKLKTERKAVAARKMVYRKRDIHPSFSWENNQLWLDIPGLSLSEIRERPVVRLYQGDVELKQRGLSVYGNDLLLSTRPEHIALDGLADWSKPFLFSVSIQSGDTQIYQSGKELHRRYFCFNAEGKETKLVQDAQQLYLAVPRNTDLVISGEEDDWSERAAPYRCVKLRAERVSSVRLNGDELMSSSDSKTSGIWPFILQNPVPKVTALVERRQVPVYDQKPVLCVEVRSREIAKNYQLILDGRVEQLYSHIQGTGKNQIELPCNPEQPSQVQIKNFFTGKILFQREYVWIPEVSFEFGKRFYYDTEETAFLKCTWRHRGRKAGGHSEKVSIKEDTAVKRLGFLELQVQIPKVRAEINGRNALLLPEMIWYETLEHAFLTLHAPPHIPVRVLLGEKELKPNATGNYEVGAELTNMRRYKKNAPLRLEVGESSMADKRVLTQVFFEDTFLQAPLKINKKLLTVIWKPDQDEFIGKKDNAAFCLKITGQNQKFEYPGLTLQSRRLWEPFPGREGEYTYTVVKKGEKKFFSQAPDKVVWQGKFTIALPPEKRYESKCIALTEALCEGPQENWIPLRRNGAVIDDIQFISTFREDGETVAKYNGNLYFETSNGWKRFSSFDTEKFEKINPVSFTVRGKCIYVYTDENLALMLNVKAYKRYGGRNAAQIYSRKDELLKEEMGKYLTFSDCFYYEEREKN